MGLCEGHFVCCLPCSRVPFPGKLGASSWRMALEIGIWALGGLIATGVFLLLVGKYFVKQPYISLVEIYFICNKNVPILPMHC